MNQDTVVNLASQAMSLGLKVAGPMLLVGLVIGLVVSVFQAVTQVQEQSLSLIPKIAGIAVVIWYSVRGCSDSSCRIRPRCTPRSPRWWAHEPCHTTR